MDNVAEQQQQPAAEDKPFDFNAWKAEQDSAEAAARTGKPTPQAPKAVDPKTATAEEKKGASVDPEDDEHDLSQPQNKGWRRRLRNAEREAAELKGRLSAYEALVAKGLTPSQAQAAVDEKAVKPGLDPALPKREAFASDREYDRAMIKYEIKLEQAEEQATQAVAAAENQEYAKLDTEAKAADVKFAEDVKEYKDWDEVAETVRNTPMDWSGQEQLLSLYALSLNRAAILYHWVKNPEDFKKLAALSGSLQQIRAFYRLEAALEKPDAEKIAADKAAADKIRKAEASKRDAAKEPPSESVRAKTGTASSGMPSMLLDDGTLNPAWKALENEKEGLRR